MPLDHPHLLVFAITLLKHVLVDQSVRGEDVNGLLVGGDGELLVSIFEGEGKGLVHSVLALELLQRHLVFYVILEVFLDGSFDFELKFPIGLSVVSSDWATVFK